VLIGLVFVTTAGSIMALALESPALLAERLRPASWVKTLNKNMTLTKCHP
jgi:hypothetical protein